MRVTVGDTVHFRQESGCRAAVVMYRDQIQGYVNLAVLEELDQFSQGHGLEWTARSRIYCGVIGAGYWHLPKDCPPLVISDPPTAADAIRFEAENAETFRPGEGLAAVNRYLSGRLDEFRKTEAVLRREVDVLIRQRDARYKEVCDLKQRLARAEAKAQQWHHELHEPRMRADPRMAKCVDVYHSAQDLPDGIAKFQIERSETTPFWVVMRRPSEFFVGSTYAMTLDQCPDVAGEREKA